jgi:peptidoglycan hydrolase CwlO-like protein
MAKRKRAARRSSLVGRAVTAGRKALKEAESRVPADLRTQVERRIRDANKTVQAAIKEAQVQVRRARSRSDVTSFLKRLDGFTKQAKQLARGTSTSRSTAKRAAPAARRAATARKPATRKAAAKQPAARAAATPRRRAARTTPPVTETPVSHPVEAPVEPPMG